MITADQARKNRENKVIPTRIRMAQTTPAMLERVEQGIEYLSKQGWSSYELQVTVGPDWDFITSQLQAQGFSVESVHNTFKISW